MIEPTPRCPQWCLHHERLATEDGRLAHRSAAETAEFIAHKSPRETVRLLGGEPCHVRAVLVVGRARTGVVFLEHDHGVVQLDGENAAQLAKGLMTQVRRLEVELCAEYHGDTTVDATPTTPLGRWVVATVDNLQRREGPMTTRERHLCTTLLHGLAAVGKLAVPEGGER